MQRDGETEDKLNTLLARFPSVDRARIVHALQATQGHAGSAVKRLKKQGATCEAVPPSAARELPFNRLEPSQHCSDPGEVRTTAQLTDSVRHSSNELHFRKCCDDDHGIRFDLTEVDGIACPTRTRFEEGMFNGSYFSFSFSASKGGGRVLDILRLYTRDLRKDHPSIKAALHGATLIDWLKEIAVESRAILRVVSTEESAGFYRRYMEEVGDGTFEFC